MLSMNVLYAVGRYWLNTQPIDSIDEMEPLSDQRC